MRYPDGYSVVYRNQIPKECIELWNARGVFDSKGVGLHVVTGQTEAPVGVWGGDLFRLFTSERLPHCVLLGSRAMLYYLDHPECIPTEWVGQSPVFWGTVYTANDAPISYVASLDCAHDAPGGKVKVNLIAITHTFGADTPAAVRWL
jgi:hypothetical protein